MPVANAARSYAYMSRTQPNSLRTDSGDSVSFTKRAQSGAIFLKSTVFTTDGALPVGGIFFPSAKYSGYIFFSLDCCGFMYPNLKPMAWPRGIKISGDGDFTMM